MYTTAEDDDLCWYHRFADSDRCQNPGRWQTDGRLVDSGFMRAVRWCDVHRHPSDVLVVKEETNPMDRPIIVHDEEV